MIEIVRRTSRNVKRWQSGDMCLRWTAAGMLEAEQQFRKVIGYSDLAKLAIAVERDLTAQRDAALTPRPPRRPLRSPPPDNITPGPPSRSSTTDGTTSQHGHRHRPKCEPQRVEHRRSRRRPRAPVRREAGLLGRLLDLGDGHDVDALLGVRRDRLRAAAGTSGLSVMRSLKPVASAASRTAPMIAVPSEDPRFCAVPWSPPASLVCVGATDDMITFPSCEASSPAPAPISASAILKPGVVELHVERREHHDRADADGDQPDPRDRARRAPRPRSAGPAARRRASPPTAGAGACRSRTRRSPSTTCR